VNTTTPSSKPTCVADALGFGSLADGEDGLNPELLMAIYSYARNESGNRILFDKDPTFARGWLNLDSGPIKQLIATFVALDDADSIKQARRLAQANLEAAPWNDTLGIDSPPIRCRVKIHGNKWGLRFETADSRMRGKELINEQLPPAKGSPPPVVSTDSASDATAPTPPLTAAPAAPATTNTEADAANILQRGGLI